MSDVPNDTEAHIDDPALAEPPKWPKVIGIISIVYGGLFTLCGGCGLIAMPFMSTMMAGAADAPGGLPPTMTPSVATYASYAAGTFESLWLLVSGIVLVMRKPAARYCMLAWVAMAIPTAIWGTIIAFDMKQQMAQFAADHPDSPFAKGVGGWTDYIGPAIQLVIGYSYPLFCLVWFGFVKKDPREYSRGVEQLM